MAKGLQEHRAPANDLYAACGTGPDARLLVDAKEAARLLSIGKSTFLKYVKNGRLPKPVKIGGSVRWRVRELYAMFAAPDAHSHTEDSAAGS